MVNFLKNRTIQSFAACFAFALIFSMQVDAGERDAKANAPLFQRAIEGAGVETQLLGRNSLLCVTNDGNAATMTFSEEKDGIKVEIDAEGGKEVTVVLTEGGVSVLEGNVSASGPFDALICSLEVLQNTLITINTKQPDGCRVSIFQIDLTCVTDALLRNAAGITECVANNIGPGAPGGN